MPRSTHWMTQRTFFVSKWWWWPVTSIGAILDINHVSNGTRIQNSLLLVFFQYEISYCSRVQKVILSSTKGEKLLDDWFPLDDSVLALDDGKDWLGIIEHCSSVIEDILGCIWDTEPVVAQLQQWGQILCCLVTNEMAITRNGSDWLQTRALSDLTWDTWQLSPWNPTVLKVIAMISLRTNQWCFSLNEQDDSKIKTMCTNVQLVSISKL
jgi:hypothetical protein